MIIFDFPVSREILSKWMSLHYRKENMYKNQKTIFITATCDNIKDQNQVSFHLYQILIKIKKTFHLNYNVDINLDKMKKNFHFILQKVNEKLLTEYNTQLGIQKNSENIYNFYNTYNFHYTINFVLFIESHNLRQSGLPARPRQSIY